MTTKVYIAIPSYTGLVASSCLLGIVGLVQELAKYGMESQLTVHSFNGNIADARNRLVHGFLESDYTQLLFLDDDMGFDPYDIVRMVMKASDWGVLGALCPRKNMATGTGDYDCYSPLKPDCWHGTGCAANVDRVGTGIMVIPRKTFEDVSPFVIKRDSDDILQFFVTSMGEETIGEDFYFCDKVVQAGMPVGIAMWTKSVTHAGRFIYKGK